VQLDLGAVTGGTVENRVVGSKGGAIGAVDAISIGVFGSDWGTLLAESLVNLIAESGCSIGGGTISSRAIGGASTLRSGVMELVAHGAGVADVLRASNTALGDGVVLSSNIADAGDIGRWAGGAKLEDRGLPFISLSS